VCPSTVWYEILAAILLPEKKFGGPPDQAQECGNNRTWAHWGKMGHTVIPSVPSMPQYKDDIH